jgi:NAD(P)-dependent dehydrogenase (short-subunit alcohol dehydrogenase family)
MKSDDPRMTARLAGRKALISSGARGQGTAHGRRLAEEGAAIVLGDILTDAGEAQTADLRVAHFLPLRRRAEPEEISAAVASLASDDAVYVTGAELAIDGGYLAR